MLNKIKLFIILILMLLPCILGAQSMVLLFDTSGSMDWKADGSAATSDDQKRITVTKDAGSFFLDVLMHNTLFPGNPNPYIGMARFPLQPYTGCVGEELESLQLLSLTALYTTFLPAINGLTATGGTPMVDGLAKAQTILTSSPHPPQNILLLSDGYHNCPSVIIPETPAFNTLVASLPSTTVHTIAIGRPGEPDDHFMEELATATSGKYYDVTDDPGFDVNDPDSWDLANALKKTYLGILVDSMGYVFIDDPEGFIESGATIEGEFFISDVEEQISIYLSWVTENREPLDFEIFASDGSPVPIKTDPKILYTEQLNYKVATIGPSILEEPGRVGVDPWRIKISAPSIGENPGKYQYGVIAKSSLGMDVSFNKNKYMTGEVINLNVQIPEENNKFNIDTAVVISTNPQEGKGNWLSLQDVPVNVIEEYSQSYIKRTGEDISPVQAKNLYMQEIMEIKPPGHTQPVTRHLSQGPDNGSFHISFDNSIKSGTYSFYIKIAGNTEAGIPFTREKLIQKHISVNATPDDFALETMLIQQDTTDTYSVSLKPADSYGNLLGPGYGKAIILKPTVGDFRGELTDNLDGTYTHTLFVPGKTDPVRVNISIDIISKKASYNLDSGRMVAGDANGDGGIDIVDALVAAQYYVGLISYIPVGASDANCDGFIDIVDALRIAQYYVGLITSLGC